MKERMINVLHWKKPKAWVSVVAVLVCAVLLISCATNPKLSKQRVDDPALLEFPGLKWGMTVDQVKEALDIKEEQILLNEQYEYPPDTAHSYERWNLYVKDLTAFGNKVTIAMFEFISITGDENPTYEFIGNTGGEFALARIQVCFDEETDMVKLKETMLEVYGPGAGSEYAYVDALSTGNPRKAKMQVNEKLRYLAGRKDNEYSAALKAPGYMEHLWVCTDPNTIADSMQAFLKDMLASHGHSEEESQEWIGQAPWISLQFTNTTPWGVAKDAGDNTDSYSEYSTHNYLEYRAQLYVVVEQYAALQKSGNK